MKILIWASTFGADLWSFTRYLDQRSGVALRIVLTDPELYLRQPVARLYPLRAPLVRRRMHHELLGLQGFRPDVTIVDNHVPLRSRSPAGFVLWHGFGWRGPNDLSEFRVLHWKIRSNWGDGRRPNERFRWQCFGPSDFEHRTRVSGFAPENCRLLGAASHDDLRRPFDRSQVSGDYPFDVVGRKTVLLAPTWHYGSPFGHWGSDADILTRVLDRLSDLGANAIIRMHDSFRYEERTRRALETVVHRAPHAVLKYKDQAPDNYIDMQVSDALVTNFSSIANLFYATRRPTIHVYPVTDPQARFEWRTLGLFRTLRKRQIPSAQEVWKFPPEQNGGLMARSLEELLAALERALAEPDCTQDRVNAYLDEHMLGADGRSCDRTWAALQELVEGNPG